MACGRWTFHLLFDWRVAVVRIKKLNNVTSVSIIEKPSLMARSIMKCMVTDLIDQQKHNKCMLHLSKKTMFLGLDNNFAYSIIKRKPFTSLVKLKQPNKLRKHPKHEPISYCYQLQMLQKPREFKLNEITLLENDLSLYSRSKELATIAFSRI